MANKKQLIKNILSLLINAFGLVSPFLGGLAPEGAAGAPVNPPNPNEVEGLVDQAIVGYQPAPDGVAMAPVGPLTKAALQGAINMVWQMIDSYQDQALALALKLAEKLPIPTP